MVPLGLGLGVSDSEFSDSIAVAIEDYMWYIPTSGELAPLAKGTVSDFHDTWDLDSGNYMPQTEATVSDEGYWDLDGTNIRPIDIS